ncbi:MFS transporter [Roseiconus lacunae]|uniref:MFS transporter n=1 Tax=Roseiconus lacunae TaxID=2605694 RepID=A0ABT7PIL5_9BACT|nr:MFS transporter [Roseiconus lacunae]MCD0458449.1 MFS transporter [Roseiconus lacunae]MDM4016337.1 MFS transporter [Roseiconus lacunae]WRQ52060.1 MFS transporter [Stieleria sp. HD01]
MKERSTQLFNPGFIGLIIAQFFGAMNDNILKVILTFMVINGAWSGDLGPGGQGIVSICFTVPFMILSGLAGQIADRYSKQRVTLWVKIAEIPIALLAGIGFYTQDLTVTLVALTALTCQSSFFGPAKYGMIPELVVDRHLSRANGAINMMTNVAVIVGTLVAGVASDHYAPDGVATGIRWLPGALLVGTAILGLFASFLIPPLDRGDKNLKVKLNPFSTYITAIREMAQTRLLMVMMAWGYFYMLAGLALFIVPEYTEVLQINHTEASVLMGVLGVAIGLGCAAAGILSGDQIRPRLTFYGAIGLVVFFFLLAAIPPSMPDTKPLLRVALSNVSLLILLAGFSAGFYIVPLQALLQKLSPDDERGQFLGTANAVSFAFMTIAGVMYPLMRPGFGDAPQKIFYLCSVLMLVGAAFFTWRLRGTGILVSREQSLEKGSDATTAETN